MKGKKTGGRRKGSGNKIPPVARNDVRDVCRAMVEEHGYRERLKLRMQIGKIAPAVETMVWHYAYGKPVETVELTGKDGGPMKHHVRITIVKKAA
jgi:hypothetical protein